MGTPIGISLRHESTLHHARDRMCVCRTYRLPAGPEHGPGCQLHAGAPSVVHQCVPAVADRSHGLGRAGELQRRHRERGLDGRLGATNLCHARRSTHDDRGRRQPRPGSGREAAGSGVASAHHLRNRRDRDRLDARCEQQWRGSGGRLGWRVPARSRSGAKRRRWRPAVAAVVFTAAAALVELAAWTAETPAQVVRVVPTRPMVA